MACFINSCLIWVLLLNINAFIGRVEAFPAMVVLTEGLSTLCKSSTSIMMIEQRSSDIYLLRHSTGAGRFIPYGALVSTISTHPYSERHVRQEDTDLTDTSSDTTGKC